jgi:hypothetical protein
MSSMQRVIARMALTASPVELCTDAISLVISPVALRRQIPDPDPERAARIFSSTRTPADDRHGASHRPRALHGATWVGIA